MGFWGDIGDKIKTMAQHKEDPMNPSIKTLRGQAINELRDATNPADREALMQAQTQAQQINKGAFDGQLQAAHGERVQRVHELRDATNPANSQELANAQKQAQAIINGPLRAGLDPARQSIANNAATQQAQGNLRQR